MCTVKLAREQCRLSRKQKGSNRRSKQRERLSRLHEKVSNARRDFLHKLSHRLVRENQAVIVEDLHVRGLAHSRLSKSIHDAAWGEFRRQLEYKALWQGKVFHRADRFFPSTRLHWDCRTLNEVSLSDRVFACQAYVRVLHRDHNAAHNIKQKGFLDLVAGGQDKCSWTGCETCKGKQPGMKRESLGLIRGSVNQEAFEKARSFIMRQGRGLEQRLFEYHTGVKIPSKLRAD